MAKCIDCGDFVAADAEHCVHCGGKSFSQLGIGGLSGLLIFGSVVALFFGAGFYGWIALATGFALFFLDQYFLQILGFGILVTISTILIFALT